MKKHIEWLIPLVILTIAVSSCQAASTPPPIVPTLPSLPGCEEGEIAEIVWSQLDEVNPVQAARSM
jgi:hypothetical protein